MTKKNIVDVRETESIKIEILEYDSLAGSGDITNAKDLYYANQIGIKLKQVVITLKNSAIQTEVGALQFHKGRVQGSSGISNQSASGLAKKMIASNLTNESAIKPIYSGTGKVFLEPSFKHYLIVELNNDEIIMDKGIFVCCEDSIEVGVSRVKSIKAAIGGGEGLFQTKLSGTGLAVLELPVHSGELMKFNLKNETMQVDGNFVLYRTGNIEFTIERSTKSIFGSVATGEGYLQTFRGIGELVIAPTQPVYDSMHYLFNPPTQIK